MDYEKFNRDIRSIYKKSRASNTENKLDYLFTHIADEWQVDKNDISMQILKDLSESVIDIETSTLYDEVDELLAQKERIERQIERKSDELQNSKYLIFNAFESALDESSEHTLSNLHQIKLQSVDLFDILGEMVESAIVKTLEKGNDIEETIEELAKEFTYDTLNEGSLSNIRVRKVMNTILDATIDVAEASSNHTEDIIKATIKGIRAGLIRSIGKFKQQLLYMPREERQKLYGEFTVLKEELFQTDTIFEQVVQSQANNASSSTKTIIEKSAKEIKYDLEELMHISKETVDVMKDKLSVIEDKIKDSKVMRSDAAKEAKRMGIQAWSVAKNALDKIKK